MKGDSKKQKDASFLSKFPLVGNALQSGAISFVGVLLSQVLAPMQKTGTFPNEISFDWKEVQVMVLINMAWITPILMWFFGFLSKVSQNSMEKLIIDQFIFSPPFSASIIGLRYLLLGGDINELGTFLWNVVPKAQITAWMYWIPARFLMISYVPADLQLLANNIGALVWTIIFSMMLNT
jgi:hypothetical protein